MHEFLLPDADAQHDPVDIVLNLRDVIEDRPPTAATFRLTSVSTIEHNQGLWVRGGSYSRVAPYGWSNTDKLLWLCGAWRDPGWHRESNNPKSRLVNPTGPPERKAQYADGLAECACGALLKQPLTVTDPTTSKHCTADDAHGECTPSERRQARHQMQAHRRAIVYNGHRLGLDQDTIAARYGIPDRRTLRREIEHMGLPPAGVAKANAWVEIGETTVVLRERFDYDTTTIGTVYDRSRRRINDYVQMARDAHGSDDAILRRYAPTDGNGVPLDASIRSRPADQPADVEVRA